MKKFDDTARIYPKVFDGKVRGRSLTIKDVTHVVTTKQALWTNGRLREANAHSVFPQQFAMTRAKLS